MIPHRVRHSVWVAFLGHGLFILTGRYRLSYDAFTHMLFANHYAENWFSLWEPRWYTGFTVVSYPPLVHQLIALFIPIFGFDKAYALMLWLVASLYPLGVYAFSRIFTGKSAASHAALASAVLLPIYVVAHIFGQLPFLTSTLLALFSAASLNLYLRDGSPHNLLLTVSLYSTTMAAHHATLLVHPFLIFAVVVNRLFRSEQSRWSSSRFILRFLLFCFLASLFCLIVIYPFWGWGVTQIMQTPIDHLSRHNFFTDPFALVIFFLPLYGPLIVVIPFLIRKWHPHFIGLLISFTILFLLGLGGTTLLPRFFFGRAWEWLTYDRFAFWASLTLTPFFGILFIGLKKKIRPLTTFPTVTGQRFTPNPMPVTLRKNLIPALTFSFFTATALGAWLTPLIFPLQPAPINMQPITDFLNKSDNSQWRYLTFGFGDQFAYLNLLTTATTIDGSYHTARTLPELRDSGIGQVDTSYWAVNGMNAIKPILQKSGEYGVRWGFVNPKTVKTIKLPRGVIRYSPFIPTLNQLGWVKIKTLENGIIVYENPNAILPQPSKPPATEPITAFSWGILPVLSLITALSLGGLRVYPIQTERVLRAVYSLTIGLIPIALCFWFYQTVAEFPHSRIYFTYTNALFFLTDALSLLAVLLWASARLASPCIPHDTIHVSRFIILLFAFCTITTFSIIWSHDWRISLYISAHFWLVLLLILSLRDWHKAWRIAMFGFCAALSIEVVIGIIEFVSQSTAFLKPLNMQWPGVLDPSMRGASVVQLANGLRVLRAYGTLPHPNILGGLAFVFLLGPTSLFLAMKKPNYPALILFSPGIILLALTFSRSTWLGLISFLAILILKSKHFDRNRLWLFIATSLLAIAFTLYPLRNLVFTRITDSPSNTEKFSIVGRFWLTEQALDIIRAHPVTGVGIGSFIIELSKQAGQGYIIEPVHNIFLLAGSELGTFGLLLIIGLFIFIALNIIKARMPNSILASATMTGLGVISLFDHYFWTLAPGRIMLGLALGLWIGQIAHDA